MTRYITKRCLLKQMQKHCHRGFIDRGVNKPYNINNITATLSALRVTRNLGGFSLSKIYSLEVTKRC